MTDEDLNSVALEVIGSNVATAYIITPIDPRASLAIKLPFIVLIVKNMNKSFSFEVQVGLLKVTCGNGLKVNLFLNDLWLKGVFYMSLLGTR